MPKRRPLYFIGLSSPHIGHFDESWCYSERYIREVMEDEEIEELTVYLAQPERDADSFFCQDVQEAYLKDDNPCGQGCAAYAPRNGKNGICRHRRGVYECTDESLILRRSDPQHTRELKALARAKKKRKEVSNG